MKIQSVLINNYKGINLSLAFNDGINVITGRNGTGKSNILEAIRFILNDEKFSSKNVVTKGKSVASVKVTFEEKGVLIDKYSVLKKIYRSGEVKTYFSDIFPDIKPDCVLLDYDSHCFMDSLKLAEFAAALKEKAKNTQIIIVSMSQEIIDIADCVFKTQKAGEQYILAESA